MSHHLVAALLVLTATVLSAGLVMAVAWWLSWWFVAGAGTGAAGALAVSHMLGWWRHRRLRELLDWLGADLEARKVADMRAHGLGRGELS